MRVQCVFFFFQAEDGIRDLVRSRGLGDVYKRQHKDQPYASSTIARKVAAIKSFYNYLTTQSIVDDLSLIHI